MAPQRMLRLNLPCAQVAQAELRHAQECSPSAQVKAAAAHVQTLKQNQRKKKLSMTLRAHHRRSVRSGHFPGISNSLIGFRKLKSP